MTRPRILTVALLGMTAAALASGRSGHGPLAAAPLPAAASSPGRITALSIVYLERRLADHPASPTLSNLAADWYMQRFRETGNLAFVRRAETLVRQAGRWVPGAKADTRLAAVLLTQHRFAEAREATRAALSRDTLNAGVNAIAFDVMMEYGDYPAAGVALRRLEPGSFAYLVRMAKWREAQGDIAGAARDMERSCQGAISGNADPATIAWCLTERAVLAVAQGREPDGRQLLAEAFAAYPGYRGALEESAWLRYRAGDLGGARERYRELLAAGGGPDVRLRLARVLAKLGDSAGAKAETDTFERLATAPGMEALYGRHLLLHLAEVPGRQRQALDIARLDVRRRPTTESFAALAWAAYRAGALAEALAAARRATAWGRPEPTVLFHAGLIELAGGQARAGRVLLAQALARPSQLDPDDEQEARALLAGR